MFVGGIVIEDDVDVFVGPVFSMVLRMKLLMAMALHTPADHLYL
jgi:hypothetical protein